MQRTTFSGGEGAVSLNIRDTVLQCTEIGGVDEKKKLEEEKVRKEEESQIRWQRKEIERMLREKKMSDLNRRKYLIRYMQGRDITTKKEIRELSMRRNPPVGNGFLQ